MSGQAEGSQLSPGADRERTCLVSDSFARPSFTLEQIRTFLIVASREHITKAARALGLSQPAVTQQVQLLERALGIPLLERLGRGVRLTEAGEEISGACLLIMRALENLENTVRAIRGLEAGSLTIGATQVAASYYLSPSLAAFSAAYPAVAVHITIAASRDICEQVAAGILECGLVDGPLPRSKLSFTRLASDELVLAVHPSHPLAGRDHLPPEFLAGSSLLLWEQSPASDAALARMLGGASQELPKIRLANLEAARQMLLAKPCYITAIPRIAIADDLVRGELATAGGRRLAHQICAVRRPGSTLSPAAGAFWADLAGSAAAGGRPACGVSGRPA